MIVVVIMVALKSCTTNMVGLFEIQCL